jgi:hypothetical protein
MVRVHYIAHHTCARCFAWSLLGLLSSMCRAESKRRPISCDARPCTGQRRDQPPCLSPQEEYNTVPKSCTIIIVPIDVPHTSIAKLSAAKYAMSYPVRSEGLRVRRQESQRRQGLRSSVRGGPNYLVAATPRALPLSSCERLLAVARDCRGDAVFSRPQPSPHLDECPRAPHLYRAKNKKR